MEGFLTSCLREESHEENSPYGVCALNVNMAAWTCKCERNFLRMG